MKEANIKEQEGAKVVSTKFKISFFTRKDMLNMNRTSIGQKRSQV